MDEIPTYPLWVTTISTSCSTLEIEPTILVDRKQIKKNCPNCGAPVELFKLKCEYCGTPY